MEHGPWDGEHITLLQEQLMEREKSPNVNKEQLSSCIAMFQSGMEMLQLVGKLPGRGITLGVTACAWRYSVGVSSFQITCDLTLGILSLADCRNVGY